MVNSAEQIRVSNSLICMEHLVNQVNLVGKVGEVGSEAATHSQTQLWATKMSSGATGGAQEQVMGRGPYSGQSGRSHPEGVIPAAGSECDVGRKGILGPEWEVLRSEGRPEGGGKAGGFAASPKDGTEGLQRRLGRGLKPGRPQGFPGSL